eukprot:Clim_evm8s161 gene=Clim_evmTU8s161
MAAPKPTSLSKRLIEDLTNSVEQQRGTSGIVDEESRLFQTDVLESYRPGKTAMDDDDFAVLIRRLADCSGPQSRAEVLATLLENSTISCSQLIEILNHLKFPAERERIASFAGMSLSDVDENYDSMVLALRVYPKHHRLKILRLMCSESSVGT